MRRREPVKVDQFSFVPRRAVVYVRFLPPYYFKSNETTRSLVWSFSSVSTFLRKHKDEQRLFLRISCTVLPNKIRNVPLGFLSLQQMDNSVVSQNEFCAFTLLTYNFAALNSGELCATRYGDHPCPRGTNQDQCPVSSCFPR
jgi:hypothetical protein